MERKICMHVVRERAKAIVGIRPDLADGTKHFFLHAGAASVTLLGQYGCSRIDSQPNDQGASLPVTRHKTLYDPQRTRHPLLLFVGLTNFSVSCLAVALTRSALLMLSYLTLLYRANTATQPNDAAFRPVLGGRTTWHLRVKPPMRSLTSPMGPCLVTQLYIYIRL